MTETRKYGWLPDLPDQRDFKYSLVSPIVIPEKTDLRLSGFMPEVYDQGQLGSCTANAIGAAWEYELKKQGLSDMMPSRLFIYYNERVIENTVDQDAGAMIRDGMKTVAQQGVCPEIKWPYIVGRFAIKPCKSCYRLALKNIALQYARVQSDTAGATLFGIKHSLASGIPVVFGFTVYQSFESDEVAKTGIVPMPAQGESVLGGHATLAVGHDDATQRFLVRNSWSKGWGMDGYFTLPYAYFNPDLTDDFWNIQLIK